MKSSENNVKGAVELLCIKCFIVFLKGETSTEESGNMSVQLNDDRSTNIVINPNPLPLPPPCESAPPQYLPPFHVGPGPPPSYEECQDLNVPPPSYESLFGRVRDVEKNSNGFVDFLKNLLILFFGTAGCTLMISVTVIIPILMIIIGSLKMDECPAERFVPIYLVVGGSFGVLKNLLNFNSRFHLALTEEEEAHLPWHKRLHFQSLLNFFLTGWFITGCVWVYRIYEPNYTDRSSSRYCNYTLYMFAFWLVTSVFLTNY
ncbi:hypothetical protein Avbf_02167 [Armadillidium vulgare]|nr:hypothetical protein Avbf_02167 [Armadillidium vulgare]